MHPLPGSPSPHGWGAHGWGAHGWAASSLGLLPYLAGACLLALVLVGLAAFVLWRRGTLDLFGTARSRAPEEDAKRILADRFAQGDINSDEFLERSAILNWTPGNDPLPHSRRKRRR